MDKIQEKTFFLIKPDALKSKEIIICLFREISLAGLMIRKSYKVVLSKDQIREVWGYACLDIILEKLLCMYLCDKELLLVVVEGENAVEVMDSIKYKLRRRYAKSRFANCIHAPNSIAEFNKHFDIIVNNKIRKNRENVGENVNIEWQFGKMMDSNFDIVVQNIWKKLQTRNILNDFKWLCSKAKQSKVKCVLLVNDELYPVSYIAKILFGYFFDWRLEKIYYYALCVDQCGKFPIAITNDIENISHLKKYFLRYKFDIITL